jgi:hypothetical protein
MSKIEISEREALNILEAISCWENEGFFSPVTCAEGENGMSGKEALEFAKRLYGQLGLPEGGFEKLWRGW